MLMRDTCSFHFSEPIFISRGATEGNKHGQDECLLPVSRNKHNLTVLLDRYNTLMPAYLNLV